MSLVKITSNVTQVCNSFGRYKNKLKESARRMQEKIAVDLRDTIQTYFNNSIVNTSFNTFPNEQHLADVKVNVTSDGSWSVIIAQGEDAVFVEFGAGVYFNGAAGSSPHPLGASLGYTIGSYGNGKGSRKSWAIRPIGNNKWTITRGTKATMPMYRSVQNLISMANKIIQIWQQVKPT